MMYFLTRVEAIVFNHNLTFDSALQQVQCDLPLYKEQIRNNDNMYYSSLVQESFLDQAEASLHRGTHGLKSIYGCSP